MEVGDLNRHIGYDLLGPVVHRWLLGLHQYISYWDDGRTTFLFCARAGVRIKKLYEAFLEGTGHPGPKGKTEMLWISRMAAAKGCYKAAPTRSSKIIADEFYHLPMSQLVEGVLRHQPDRLARFDLDHANLKAHGFNFPGWILSEDAGALRAYLEQCSDAFRDYLGELTSGSGRVVLIDSGWRGTTQSLLRAAFPRFDWKGLYFGRILTPGHDKAIADDVIGLMFQAERFDPKIPETAFVEHRHIIETLLEPNGPSIEEVLGGEFAATARKLVDANLAEEPTPEHDSLYLHVLDYLQDNSSELGFAQIMARHQAAMSELARIIITPNAEEAQALACKDRSADFGKELLVPVLVDPAEGSPSECDRRIDRALWRQGQIALEYRGGVAREMQLRLSGCADAKRYFDPRGSADSTSLYAASENKIVTPSVDIITRTKNRPLLLKRAAESVAAQTYPEYSWIVVNDGGDEDAVREVLDQCTVDKRRITLVSNSESLGMEAASNAGIRNAQGEFIVIHDDDDSWAPEFLEKAVDYLTDPAGARYGGVITHSLYVSEEIRGHSVVEHGRTPYQGWVRNVQLAEMACGNFFPPIAFVFRRSVWDDIGGYNEGLPVLGDWYFNMEFLLRADIGVIPEPLAFYHHRDRGDSRNGLYANSVIGGVSKHEEFASIARNEFLRKNVGRFPVAIAALHGYVLNDVRQKHVQVRAVVGSTAGAGSPVPTAQNDEADRYWVMAQVNRAIADIPLLKRFRMRDLPKSVEPDASLNDMMSILERLGVELPTPPDFDEELYLERNQDVAAAVAEGSVADGYRHFLFYGRAEGRDRPRREA